MWMWLGLLLALAGTWALLRWASRGRSYPLSPIEREDNQGQMAPGANPPHPREEHPLWPDRTGDRTRVELGGLPKHEDDVPGQERGPAPPTSH
jgi:hypothetical protein